MEFPLKSPKSVKIQIPTISELRIFDSCLTGDQAFQVSSFAGQMCGFPVRAMVTDLHQAELISNQTRGFSVH